MTFTPIGGSGRRAQQKKLERWNYGDPITRRQQRERTTRANLAPSPFVLPDVRSRISRRDSDNLQSVALLATTRVIPAYRTVRRRRPESERPSAVRIYRETIVQI